MKRFAVLVASALILVGMATAVPLALSGGVADATSYNLRWSFSSNTSSYPENNVHITFKCSSTTGNYTLKITKINLVNQNGQSFAQNGDLEIDGEPGTPLSPTIPVGKMTQDPTNGFWQVNAVGNMPLCISGIEVDFIDDADYPLSYSPAFYLSGTLS